MYKYFILLICLLPVLEGRGQTRKERKQLFESRGNYEIQMLGVGQDGTKVFKIWAYGKNMETALVNGKKPETKTAHLVHPVLLLPYGFYPLGTR